MLGGVYAQEDRADAFIIIITTTDDEMWRICVYVHAMNYTCYLLKCV